MKTALSMGLLALSLPLALGCKGDGQHAAQEHSVKGKVLAVDPDKASIKLDHEEIPGVMGAMKMMFDVADPKVLQGLKVGDQVQGKLKVESGKYIITQLEKVKADSQEDAEVKANLAKLGPEDRKLAEAQRLCPVSEEPLGSMGVPDRITVEGQPVLLCCKSCEKKALGNPAQTLAKVKELKAKAPAK
jgi:Cu/Ag efflux protein CusF